MAQSSAYKSYERGVRQLLSESGFSSGIMYTDKPLTEEYIKLLVNFDYKDDGASLVPRGGYNVLSTHTAGGVTAVHHLLTSGKFVVDCVDVGQPPEQRIECIIQGRPEPTVTVQGQRSIIRYPTQELVIIMDDTRVVSQLCKKLPTSTEDADTVDVPVYYAIGEAFTPTKKPVVHGMQATANGPNKIIHAWFNSGLYMPLMDDSGAMVYGKLEIVKKAGQFYHSFSPVTPADVSVSEALSTGYNMLKETPYSFSNKQGTAFIIDGITPFDKPHTDTARKVVLSAKLGTTIYFDMVYQYPATTSKFTTRWEMWDLDASTDWIVLQTEKTSKDTTHPGAAISTIKNGGDAISLAYTPTASKFQIRCSIYEVSGTTVAATATKILILPVYNLADSTSDTKNAEAKVYQLTSCTGMMPWRRRILMWGAPNAENVVWMSDTNDPSYMPYPHNATIFDEDVVHITTFQDNVLVFTASKIYQMTLNEQGTGFVRTLVQDRLSISEEDKYVIQVIKNMIYFKSDNYYYMIVPKTASIRQEQTIAPVSRPVLYLLDNFEAAVRNMLDTLYFGTIYTTYDLALERTFNYVDNTIVRNVYRIRCTSTEITASDEDTFIFSFVLNYDTIQRTWTMYCYQSSTLMVPYKQTITDATTFISCYDGQFVFIKSDALDNRDNIHPEGAILKNYQLLDTGYREHNSQYKKRYRELQMKINNTSKDKLDFYSEFIIDDDVRRTYQRYATRHITDPHSPDYGLFYVERIPETTWSLQGTTKLSDVPEDYTLWTLDFSRLPDITTAKVRMGVSGKGYAGRFKFMSYNEKPFELLSLNWVFRVLYAR